jgi:hypothetical protein
MRYRLMATYRGVPYEVGLGPSNFEVVLFAACPPPEELGFEPATGHWRKQVIRAEIDALWESRPLGTFRGEPCIVLDDPGDRLHIAYLGTDPDRAASLGYWQVDRGVFELLAPREEVSGLTEERVDKALHWGEQADETGPMATYPYGRAPWPVAAPPVPAPQSAPEAAAPAANTALADAAPAGPRPTDARHDGAPQADTSRASASSADIPLAAAPQADIARASTPPSGMPRASAEPDRTQPASAPLADTQPARPPAVAMPRTGAPPADVPRARAQQAGTLPTRAPAAGLSRTSAAATAAPAASAPLGAVPRAGAAPAAAPAPPGDVPPASTQQASTQPTSAPPTEIPRPSPPPAEIPRASAPLDDTPRANAPLTGTAPASTPPVNAPEADAPLASAQLANAPLASATLADVAPARAQRATGTLSAAPAQQTAPAEPTASAERAIPLPGEAGSQPPSDTWPPHVNAKVDPYQDHISGGEVNSLREEPDSQPLPVPPGFYDPENAAPATITPPGDVGGRAARRRRVSTREIFCELADLASIPRAAYALETEIEGAMCLLPTPDGFDVFIAADGMRHELRSFTDEEAAYFYLFGVLMAEAIRSGAQAPAVAATNPYGGTV